MLERYKTICVHNGYFHGDDVTAVAMVKLCNKNINVVRTRDMDIINGADTIAVDVGNSIYDHHAPEKIYNLETRIPMCGCSLLWDKHYGEIIHAVLGDVNEEEAFYIKRQLINILLNSINCMDNAYNWLDPDYDGDNLPTDYYSIIDSFIYSHGQLSLEEKFDKAVDFSTEVLTGLIRTIHNRKVFTHNPYWLTTMLKLYIEEKGLHIDTRQNTLELFKQVCEHILTTADVSLIRPSSSIQYAYEKLTCSTDILFKKEIADVAHALSIEAMLYYTSEKTTNFETIILNLMHQHNFFLEDESIVTTALAKATRDNLNYIYLENEIDTFRYLLSVLDPKRTIDYVIYKQDNVRYCVSAIGSKYYKFDSRYHFPTEWAGLSDEELQNVSGIQELTYCHTGLGFIVSTTLDGAFHAIHLAK